MGGQPRGLIVLRPDTACFEGVSRGVVDGVGANVAGVRLRLGRGQADGKALLCQ